MTFRPLAQSVGAKNQCLLCHFLKVRIYPRVICILRFLLQNFAIFRCSQLFFANVRKYKTYTMDRGVSTEYMGIELNHGPLHPFEKSSIKNLVFIKQISLTYRSWVRIPDFPSLFLAFLKSKIHKNVFCSLVMTKTIP